MCTIIDMDLLRALVPEIAAGAILLVLPLTCEFDNRQHNEEEEEEGSQARCSMSRRGTGTVFRPGD